MSTYKDLLHAIKDVQLSTVRIGNNGEERGAPIRDKTDRLFLLLKQIRSQYGGRVSTQTNGGKTVQTYTIRAHDEFGDRGEFDVTFTYRTGLQPGVMGHVSVSVKPLD